MLILTPLCYASDVTVTKMVVSTRTAIPYAHTPTLIHILVFQNFKTLKNTSFVESIWFPSNKQLLDVLTKISMHLVIIIDAWILLEPYFSVAFSRYKSVSINICDFFQNKVIESKYKLLFSETYVEKFQKYFWFFNWNPYLKTDSANLHIHFSVNDFHKKAFRNFYVMFPAIIYVLHLEKHKMQKVKNRNINTEK